LIEERRRSIEIVNECGWLVKSVVVVVVVKDCDEMFDLGSQSRRYLYVTGDSNV
jgi:hypothetical protein